MAEVVGNGLTTTDVEPGSLVHPLTVTVTWYVPASVNATAVMVGFCNPEL